MENIKPTPEEIFNNKRPDKIYVSPQFAHKDFIKDSTETIQEIVRPFRKISKIITTSEGNEYVKQGQEIVIRLTPEERQEIIASVYEDTRNITTLRVECYSVSKEVSGGISQIQKSIQKSLSSLTEKFSQTDNDNNPVKNIYNYQPKGYLVIGSLSEFYTEKGVNESKYSSFELFRRNLSNPEIITFDELYERAKFIVSTTETLPIT